MTRILTSHSEYGSLRKVYIKKAEAAFRSQTLIDQQWESLNYLSRPNFSKAIEEYSVFENVLRRSGTEIFYFDEDDQVTMDSMYCRDATIQTDYGVILCQMGKLDRIPEAASCEKIYRANGEPVLGSVQTPGCIEGGDVAWLDQHTLAVAHGYRTNDEGYHQIKKMLQPRGVEVIQVDLPHYKGKNDVFHLMSIFSPVDKDKAVVYSPLMPVRFRDELIKRGYTLIEVPDEEFESMGCNVLATAPSQCIMVSGNPITHSRLEAAGCSVVTYKGEDISVKGGGGPTCLTRPVLREL